MRLAEVLPGAAFLGLERLSDNGAAARRDWTTTTPEGAGRSDPRLADRRRRHRLMALTALLAGLEMEGPSMLVIDMLEEGLDTPTRRRSSPAFAAADLTPARSFS